MLQSMGSQRVGDDRATELKAAKIGEGWNLNSGIQISEHSVKDMGFPQWLSR